MILVKGSELGFKGSAAMILAEYTYLTKKLREVLAEKFGKEFAEKQIEKAIEDSKKSTEQIENEVDQMIKDIGAKKVIRDLVETINEIMEEDKE